MHRLKYLKISVVLVVLLSSAVLSYNVSARQLAAPTHIGLGNAEAFAVLAGAGITNTGATNITGDAGSSPTSTETGFATVTFHDGTNHTAADPNDAFTQQAKTDLTTAYNNAAGQIPQTAIPGGIIGGGMTLLPGIYNSGSSIHLNGSLTLDGGGDPNAVFVFQAGSTLVTASGSTVVLANGTQSCNVYWQVGSSATLGTTSNFVGTIMADQAITDNGGSTIDGRFLARIAAVTLNNTTISRPLCGPVLHKSFTPASLAAGGFSLLTITFTNTNTVDATLTADFTDSLPTGVIIAVVPNVATTCTGAGTLTAVAGSSSVSMATGRIIPGSGSCTLTVNVTAPGAGAYLNILDIGVLVTSAGSNATAASATLTSIAPNNVTPTITTTLSSAIVTVGSSVHDRAILIGTGITNAGGSVIYTYFTDSACTLNPKIVGTVPVTNGVVPDSIPVIFNLPGTYYWQAIYSGAAGFNGATSICTSEILTVNKATPTLTSTASGPVTAGMNITDTAHLGGGYGVLSGTLTFEVFAPGDESCSTPITVAPWVAVIVTGAGNYTSSAYASTVAGAYRWIVHYSGNAQNNALTSACNEAGETSTVYRGTGPSTNNLPAVLPNTGFSPQHVTILPAQPAEKAYVDLGSLWLEIPRLAVQIPIMGVPQTNGQWDVSWLGNQAGWLANTAFPSWAGNSVLTGHVYDANGKPGPFVGLNRLAWGDKVIVHAWGAKYVYEVRQVMQVGPKAISSVIKHEDFPWVTLMSCSGYDLASDSYKYREVVRAVLMEVK